MSEKKTTEEVEVTTAKAEKTTAKKPAAEKTEKKKDNWFVRTGRKIKKGMSDHPFWTAFGGAAVGTGLTVGVAEVGKRVINSREAKRQASSYIPDSNNDLDPNA